MRSGRPFLRSRSRSAHCGRGRRAEEWRAVPGVRTHRARRVACRGLQTSSAILHEPNQNSNASLIADLRPRDIVDLGHMHAYDLILTLTGGLGAALLFGYVTHRLGLSPIVGYLVAGTLVGP